MDEPNCGCQIAENCVKGCDYNEAWTPKCQKSKSGCSSYTDAATCNADDTCYFVNSENECKQRCSAYCTDGLCMSPTGEPDPIGGCCEANACSPAGPWWFTSYPNKPAKNSPFTLIVHGCFGNGSIRVIPAGNASCGDLDKEAAMAGCTMDAGTDPLTLGGACGAVQRNAPTKEPLNKMELLINMSTRGLDMTSPDDVFYTVCYGNNDGTWTEVPTHKRSGEKQEDLAVGCGVADDECGSWPRSAAELQGQMNLEECCEGLKIGEVCLPTALVIILWIALIGAIIYLAYRVMRSKKDANEGGAKKDPLLESEQK